jgi:hypothetical protein
VRRLLSEPSAYLRGLFRSALTGWDRFFFTPADPTPLGLVRLAVGALLFWDLAVLGLDLRDYLGSDGWIGPEAVRHYLAQNAPWAWSFWLWVPDRWLPAVWAACLVVTALFAAGLASRVTAPLAWAIAVSTVRRAPVALFGFDHMVATWALYLAAFGASGQAVSLDRAIARWRAARRAGRGGPIAGESSAVPVPTVTANLSLRMIQLHLALIYGSAGLAKLMGPEWWNGTAMEMIMLTPEFRRFDLAWLAAYPTALALATYGGLAVEVGYPALIWSPRLRPLLLVSVALLHLGIDLFLGLTEFGLAMITANLAFASGPWLRGLVTGTRGPSGSLACDAGSPRARSLAALLSAMDPGGVLAPADGPPPPRGLTLVDARGRTFEGPDAALVAARWLPLLRPIGLLARLPGVRALLRRGLQSFLSGGTRDGRRCGRPATGPVRAAAAPPPEPLVSARGQ